MATDTTTKETERQDTIDCKNTLAEGLGRLFNDETTSDITIVVGNKRYALHKNILAASSEFFRQMFYGSQWTESSSHEVKLHETPACEYVFDTFIQSFYTGSITFSLQNAPDLLLLADKYDAKVKRDCLQFMISKINKGYIESALAWLPVCNQIKAVRVLERCYTIIKFNLGKSAEMSGWSLLPFQDIVAILEGSDIIVPSEFSVYLAVQNWVSHQKDYQLETIEKLLSLVEFKKMAPSELLGVEQSTLASCKVSAETVKKYLYDAFRCIAIELITNNKNNPDLKKPHNSCKLYTGKIQSVQFKNHAVSITPQSYNDDVSDICNIARKYSWTLSYKNVANGKKFELTMPNFHRIEVKEYMFSQYEGGYNLQKRIQEEIIEADDELPSYVKAIITVILHNAEGVVTHITRASDKVSRLDPSVGFEGVDFLLEDKECSPKEGFVAFEFQKVNK